MRRALSVLVVVGLGCGAPVEPCGAYDFPPSLVGGSPSELFPQFADAPMHSLSHSPTRDGVDVLFVAEGFRSEDLPRFRSEVGALAADFANDVLGRRYPGVFRFHRLELASATDRVKNGVLDDTVLGACLRRGDDGSFFWRVSNAEPLQLLQLRFPDVDAVVVLINGDEGRSNAELGFVSDRSRQHLVLQRSGDGVSTLTHELGHALFSLGDEYVDLEEALPVSRRLRGPADALVETANLSLSAGGEKWSDLVVGAQPGGAQYRHEVWHPTTRCRMLNSSGGAPFCPVCEHAVAQVMEVFAETAGATPPECGVLGPEPLTLSAAQFRLVSQSPGSIWLRIGCDEPCPRVRPPEVVRAGAGWFHTNPPADWSEHQLACLLDCRYPGDPSQSTVVIPTSATSAPGTGVFEVSCSNDAGAAQHLVPYVTPR